MNTKLPDTPFIVPQAAGGHARSAKLSPERRKEIAALGVAARWGPGAVRATDELKIIERKFYVLVPKLSKLRAKLLVLDNLQTEYFVKLAPVFQARMELKVFKGRGFRPSQSVISTKTGQTGTVLIRWSHVVVKLDDNVGNPEAPLDALVQDEWVARLL